jgi:hypothetical protein
VQIDAVFAAEAIGCTRFVTLPVAISYHLLSLPCPSLRFWLTYTDKKGKAQLCRDFLEALSHLCRADWLLFERGHVLVQKHVVVVYLRYMGDVLQTCISNLVHAGISIQHSGIRSLFLFLKRVSLRPTHTP